MLTGSECSEPVGCVRWSGGVSVDLHRLAYSTWHFEAAATQTVSADLIHYQKNSLLSSLSKLFFFLTCVSGFNMSTRHFHAFRRSFQLFQPLLVSASPDFPYFPL